MIEDSISTVLYRGKLMSQICLIYMEKNWIQYKQLQLNKIKIKQNRDDATTSWGKLIKRFTLTLLKPISGILSSMKINQCFIVLINIFIFKVSFESGKQGQSGKDPRILCHLNHPWICNLHIILVAVRFPEIIFSQDQGTLYLFY